MCSIVNRFYLLSEHDIESSHYLDEDLKYILPPFEYRKYLIYKKIYKNINSPSFKNVVFIQVFIQMI